MGQSGRNDVSVEGAPAGSSASALWRLVYVSTAKVGITDDDLDDILRSARARNFFQLDLTGMLMLVGGSFCQILEGSYESVNVVFELISRDPRHHNVRMLELTPIATRSFPNWTMGPPSRAVREFAEASDVNEYLGGIRDRVAAPAPDVLRIMRDFHAGTLVA